MSTFSRWAAVFCILILNLFGLSHAGEHLDKAALEALIKGNTVEGKRIKWETTYKMYYDPSGEFRNIDSNNTKQQGEWEIQSDGTLCVITNREKCITVRQRDDGGYDVYRAGGQLVFTMDKVTAGNPYNL